MLVSTGSDVRGTDDGEVCEDAAFNVYRDVQGLWLAYVAHWR